MTGGAGGGGGAAGIAGGAGTLYVSPTVTVNVSRTTQSATTHAAAQYTITFNADGGTLPSGGQTATATLGCAMPSITVPTRTGYTFGGYYTMANGGGTQYYTAAGASSRSWDKTEATPLYAKWTANTYSVKFNANGGSGSMSNESFTYDAAKELTANAFARTGYTFGGWATSATGATVYNDGQSVSNLTATAVATVNLYAVWTANIYAVTLDRQSGTGGSSSATATYGSAMPSITVPTRTGYTFGGYYTAANGDGTQYYTASGASARTWDKVEATTLYAKWTAKTYTVTLDAQGGSGGSMSATATFGSAMPFITLPTRTGYTFGGYYTAANGGGTQYYTASGASARSWDKTAATTLYAKWTANTYTISFDANGGTHSSTVQTATATFGGALPDCIPAPTRDGCAFYGWSADQAGTSVWYGPDGTKELSSYTVPGNTTLYAIWSPEAPVITPADGTILSGSVSVVISCATEGAVIHFTTNGAAPTAESPVYRRFRVTERTTVKAVAVKDGLCSAISVAEYALGQCADPVITPADGTTFEHSGQSVSIAWSGEDGVLRYTTDGSDPTTESPIYGGPFTIDETTVVKAKAFGDQFFDSAIVTANLTRVWLKVATPVIQAQTSFTGSRTSVALSCATEGSRIYYTTNGSTPTTHSTRYTGSFFVTDSCTVKAVAVCTGYADSAVASFAITKVWVIGDTMGDPDQPFTTGGNLPFVRVADATAPLGESMKSGAITHSQVSTLSTTVNGPGTVSFQWKSSCEKDPDDWFEWDHAEFRVDGSAVARLDGVTGWQTVSHEISAVGSHTLEWRYAKDDMESDGEDCCWVAGFQWTPTASTNTATQTTPEPVPYAWFDTDYPALLAAANGDYEVAALATAANGRKVWECYVAGLDPTKTGEDFSAFIEMVDGAPRITWWPSNVVGRTYAVWGRKSLSPQDVWETPTNATHRFFQVRVGLSSQATPQNCTITFDSAGGSAVAPITAAVGTTVTAPTSPTKQGYTFAGWSPTFPATMPLGGATLVAQWTPDTSYFNYSVSETGFATVNGVTQKPVGALDIPSEIDGHPVTGIGGSAFFGYSGLTSVTIPDSVTRIGDWAFESCSGLVSVTIGNGVTSIGNLAFAFCNGLTSVTIPNSVTSIGAAAFGACSNLVSVTIPASVTNIEISTFYGCSGLSSVTLPNTVTSIGDSAFYGCSDLTWVTIPDSVTSIGEYAFEGCWYLESISIPASLQDQTSNWGLPSDCWIVVRN